ncbi:MAG: hypothetical protein CM15mV107_340 [Caudoviricetes sp.]|nr:MAG: hypothetical protein CM15mV107_340 [Caudoviricetes sp.]
MSATPPVVHRVTLRKTILTKTNNYKNKSFEPFWKTYLEIPKDMRVISLSKKLAYNEFMKLDTKTRDKLKQCLEADIRARTKHLKQDKFTPLFPDAHRWIKNGQYEQYLLTLDKKAPTFKKPKTTPF